MTAKIESIDDFDVWFKYEKEGWTQKEIADFYGVSRGCIYFRLYPEKAKSENIKEAAKRYSHTDKGKAARKKDNQSDKGKARLRRYRQTDKSKETAKRHNSKHRGLSSISLNEPFENCHAHHIDEEHIIHIPAELHRSVTHNVFTGKGMEEINSIAFQYITEEMFDKLLAGEI